ncbi:MAG: ATP-binding cassette domain-containing protein [Verrucomicrobiae bacterium]|nr:ATP-binding cassette domain-containing protein [Verrucomicrobiae bacterium]
MGAASPSPTPLVELHDVDVPPPGDPDQVLVGTVNWTVLEHDRWLVAGPSGAGKSSVLGVAAGLVRPPRGSHRLFGANLATLGERERVAHRSQVGLVFSGGGRLFRNLTVAENIALPLGYHGRGSFEHWVARTSRLVSALELTPFAGRLPGELPRRIAQRVALARALALEPRLLILDDPVSGLGPEDRTWWSHLLRGNADIPMPSTLILACSDAEPWSPWATRHAFVQDRCWQVTENPPPHPPPDGSASNSASIP